MLNIIILEDQAEQAERLSQMLKKYAEVHEGFSYNLKLYDRSIPFLTEYKCDADILFLDIQIPDMLGIEAAKRIREMDNRVMIIFITMLTQYAIEGYSVGAFDYVLKPVRYEEFSTKMDRVCRMLAHQNTSLSLEVRTKEEIRRINALRFQFLVEPMNDLISMGCRYLQELGRLRCGQEDIPISCHFTIHEFHVDSPKQFCYTVLISYEGGFSHGHWRAHSSFSQAYEDDAALSGTAAWIPGQFCRRAHGAV